MFPFLPESLDESNYGPPEMISPTVAAASLPGYFMASFFPMEMAGGSRTDHIPTDRAVLASRNHREAEKRRRERIKSHLDRLRAILSCDPKTDKASLLAKAVEHVRDLKQRISEISQAQLFPTETDEISVLSLHSSSSVSTSDGARRTVFEASVCCDDRSDLLPELIETLRALRMKTLRAEMATLGGRVRNVLVLAKEKDKDQYEEGVIGDGSDEDGGGLIREALMSVVNRQASAADRSKRRRIVDNTDMYV